MRQTARRHAINAVRPSPARAEAPEPDVWIPILDLDLLEALGSEIDPVLLRELDELERCFLEPPAPEPARLRASFPTPPRLDPAPVPAEPEPLAQPIPVTLLDQAAVAPVVETGVATGHLRHRLLHWVILTVALGIVVAGVPYFLRSPAQRRVTLDVDGASFTRTTRVDDVSGLLADAGVAVAPGDRVTPAPGASLRNGATVRVVRGFPVTVDVGGALRSVRTTAKTVKMLRRELEIPAAMVAVGAPDRLRRGDTVAFRTPFGITLTADGVSGTLTSTARTVGELLAERGVPFVAGDQIEPALDAPLAVGLAITITHTSAGRVAEDTPVPFEVQEQADASLQPIVGSAQQSGLATWYATLYQPGTCAHLHIPFGTIVRVVDTDTGASATCRVADRGPEAWTGNIIDLSPDVFEQLQLLSAGVIHVRLDY